MTTIEGEGAEHIYDAAKRAVAQAQHERAPVKLIFNDTWTIAHPESFYVDVAKIWELRRMVQLDAMEGRV